MAEQTGSWQGCLHYAAISDVGRRRANNQDAFKLVPSEVDDWTPRGHVFIVADGMGAHAAGELASKMAVDAISHHYHKFGKLSPPEALKAAVLEANKEIYDRGQENVDFHNMGTTASILVVLPQGALVGHVGDSRVYRVRGSRLDQLTFDHSLVWELRKHGQISANAEQFTSIPKNVITRSLGPNQAVEVDIEGPDPIAVGDTYLLCSDGLTGRVSDEELGPILSSMSPLEAAHLLVDLANLRGGPDNITVVVVQVTGEQVVTGVGDSTPLVIGGAQRESEVPLLAWVAGGVCFLSAIAMFILGQSYLAIASLAVGAGSLLAGIGWKLSRQSGGTSLAPGLRLGNGPHVSIDCPAADKFTDKLAKIVEELREAASENEWAVDWSVLDGHCEQAVRAASAREHRDSIKSYGLAIHAMITELHRLGVQ